MRSTLTGTFLLAAGVLAPPSLFAADSCDGRDVATDATSDAVNPAPGGAGPTSQADIVSLSFDGTSSSTHLLTTLKIANLTRTPSPGTTLTSYFVTWTSSNDKTYGTEMDVDQGTLAAYWGECCNSGGLLTTFNAVTGTFVGGPNGTITVPVPLSGIGDPPIPITDPSGKPAVRNPYAYVLGGLGVLGTGSFYPQPMDRAPNAGAGDQAFVCTTPPPPPSGDPCTLPGITLLSDAANDSTNPFAVGQNPNPGWDLLSLSLAEPYSVAPAKLVFTLKVQSLSVLPENTRWPIQFRVEGDPSNLGRWVDMRTDASGAVSFKYGTFAVTASTGAYGAPTTVVSDADAASTYNADGTITIVVSLDKLGLATDGTAVGKSLSGFLIRVRVGTDVAASTPDNMPDSLITSFGKYTLVGNNPYCRPNTAPIIDSFTASPGAGTSPLLVTLTGTAHDNDTQGPDPADTIASYTFAFGDASPSVTQAGASATHTYGVSACSQTYSASLAVTDSRGKPSDSTMTVPVTVSAANRAPLAALSLTPSSGDTLDSITLDAGASADPDSGCDSIASFAFDFGDGTPPVTQAAPSVPHTYSTPGTYTASVVATDTRGATGSASAQITISPVQNRPPVPAFSADPTEAAAPVTVNFDAGGSYDPDTSRTGDAVMEYDFDFGDGTTATVLAPATTVSHEYVQPGVYDVTLRVFDKGGLASSSDALLQIRTLNTPPTPALAATPTTSPKNSAVQFDASGTKDPNGDAVSEYDFDFGDGATLTGAASQVSHAYAHAGSYTASLRARDARGDLSATAATLVIEVTNQVPVAALSAQPQSGTGPLQVDFDAGASSDPDAGDSVASYTFDFGDGSAPVTRVGGATVQHLYSDAQAYTASVTVQDQDGAASAPATILITVASANRAPVARLAADRLAGDIPLVVHFDAGSSSDTDGDAVTQYTFSFGDGSAPLTQDTPTISHTYSQAGRYTAVASVRDARGAQSSNSDALTINASLPANETSHADAFQDKHGPFGGALSPYGLLVLLLAGARPRRRR